MEVPENFPFPFEPYGVQKEFMKQIYRMLENRGIGIFESPTGTGKSLSLCCGSLKWLQDFEAKEIADLSTKIENLKIEIQDNNTDEDWLKSEYEKIQRSHELNALQKKLENINKSCASMDMLRSRKSIEKINREWHLAKNKCDKTKIVESSNELDPSEKLSPINDVDLLIDELNLENDEDDEREEQEEVIESGNVKIIYCSRTHSQLSQFVNEIKMTSFSSTVRVVSLASRQQYCINPSVQKLKSSHLINERCLELQKGKKGKTTSKAEDGKATKRSKCSSGCQFYNQSKIEILRDETLIDIKDMEDIVVAAKQIEACPYYSARAAVRQAQVIIVPYQTLLHEATRRANGISVKENIVIIDEAHNLLDTISHIHSAEVTGTHLQAAWDKLRQYRDKYHTRFAAKNLLQLNQVIYIVGKLLGMLNLTPNQDKTTTDSKIHTLEEFVHRAEIDNFNFRPLIDFCVKSKLPQKLHSFSERYTDDDLHKDSQKTKEYSKSGLQFFLNKMSEESIKGKKKLQAEINPESESEDCELRNQEKYVSIGNALQNILNFLEMLTNKFTDGRILVTVNQAITGGTLKFLLLNPAARFSDIVRDARSVIVTGGTMRPFSEFREQLFISAGASIHRVLEISCGHVIPPANILPICLSEGPSGKNLRFTFELRNSLVLLNELGRILQNVCNIVPGGVICFFPSYDYENHVFNHLKSCGVLEKIENKKKVFREPKTTKQVDQVLEEYSNVIKSCKTTSLTGAVMFSIVGGKLSEGLNFSDDLGRCVIVVGMPYPSIKSLELREKMKYLNENVSVTAGGTHYENICIKAINQSIGRAIRHHKDYAAVLLLDERYSKECIRNSLPKWLQLSLIPNAKFGPMFGAMSRFFLKHKINPSQ